VSCTRMIGVSVFALLDSMHGTHVRFLFTDLETSNRTSPRARRFQHTERALRRVMPPETDKKVPATDKGNALITASAFLEAATPSVEMNKEMVSMLIASTFLTGKWAGLRSTPWVHLSCRRMPTIPHEGCLELHIHVRGLEASWKPSRPPTPRP
jgi:hypothetical protein